MSKPFCVLLHFYITIFKSQWVPGHLHEVPAAEFKAKFLNFGLFFMLGISLICSFIFFCSSGCNSHIFDFLLVARIHSSFFRQQIVNNDGCDWMPLINQFSCGRHFLQQLLTVWGRPLIFKNFQNWLLKLRILEYFLHSLFWTVPWIEIYFVNLNPVNVWGSIVYFQSILDLPKD